MLEACIDRPLRSLHAGAWRMRAFKHLQHPRSRTLHAEGHPSESSLAQFLKHLEINGVGIGFRCDLSPIRQSETRPDLTKHMIQTSRTEQGRGAAPEEDCADPLAACKLTRGKAHFCSEHLVKAVATNGVAKLGGGVGVEVAVATAARAEGHVHVQRQGARRTGRHYFFDSSPVDSAAMNASCGTSTRPTIFMRFLPSFCFSRSLRLRLMSPP